MRLFVCWFALLIWPLAAQNPAANYDEAKVPAYTLPDPLAGVKRPADWPRRRQEILELFAREVYGRTPTKQLKITHELRSMDRLALGGQAIRKEITVFFSGKDGPRMEIMLYLPAQAKGRVPVFLGLNYQGNHGVHPEPGIALSQSWMRSSYQGVVNNRSTEAARGKEASRWPVELILSRGYGLATVYYGDIDPDFDDGFANGVHPLFYAPGQTKPGPDEWGSIGAWAWGLSRTVDYLAKDPAVDAQHIALVGHSRLGKTALWAGAQDPRFAIVISNDSGEGGAALARRRFGETTAVMNKAFPHWFADSFNKYSDRENEMPFDQHMLLALIAPRPVYVASAAEDQWADPKGEFLSLVAAEPVYRLLGTKGLAGVTEMPAVHQPVHHHNGYHIRAGKHDVTEYDWRQWLDFADRHWKPVR